MNGKPLSNRLYDNIVWILLIWCVFQDFVLASLFSVTQSYSLVKILFFGKDFLMLFLFFFALLRIRMKKKVLCLFLFYYFVVFIHLIHSIIIHDGSHSFTHILSSVRGLILLPTFMIIGLAVKDKNIFFYNIKKYYIFLIFIAIIGLCEFLIDGVHGTKDFWMDTLKLNDYYTSIKGQPALIENGTPGNWYTDIGGGYRTQKRLISVWAAPLTAGFVLLMPSMYYSLNYVKKKKIFSLINSKKDIVLFVKTFVVSIALLLTFTRQTILPFILIVTASVLFYNRKNRSVLFACITVFSLACGLVLFETIKNYLYNGSTIVHIMRIKNAISQMSIWGKGIASFGTRFSGSISTESQYLTIIGQIGIIAIVLYLILLFYPIVFCRNIIKTCNDRNKIIIISVCFSGLVFALAGIVSETVAAFTSIAQYYVFIGVSWGYCRDIFKECNNVENKDNCNVSSSIS